MFLYPFLRFNDNRITKVVLWRFGCEGETLPHLAAEGTKITAEIIAYDYTY